MDKPSKLQKKPGRPRKHSRTSDLGSYVAEFRSAHSISQVELCVSLCKISTEFDNQMRELTGTSLAENVPQDEKTYRAAQRYISAVESGSRISLKKLKPFLAAFQKFAAEKWSDNSCTKTLDQLLLMATKNEGRKLRRFNDTSGQRQLIELVTFNDCMYSKIDINDTIVVDWTDNLVDINNANNDQTALHSKELAKKPLNEISFSYDTFSPSLDSTLIKFLARLKECQECVSEFVIISPESFIEVMKQDLFSSAMEYFMTGGVKTTVFWNLDDVSFKQILDVFKFFEELIGNRSTPWSVCHVASRSGINDEVNNFFLRLLLSSVSEERSKQHFVFSDRTQLYRPTLSEFLVMCENRFEHLGLAAVSKTFISLDSLSVENTAEMTLRSLNSMVHSKNAEFIMFNKCSYESTIEIIDSISEPYEERCMAIFKCAAGLFGMAVKDRELIGPYLFEDWLFRTACRIFTRKERLRFFSEQDFEKIKEMIDVIYKRRESHRTKPQNSDENENQCSNQGSGSLRVSDLKNRLLKEYFSS